MKFTKIATLLASISLIGALSFSNLAYAADPPAGTVTQNPTTPSNPGTDATGAGAAGTTDNSNLTQQISDACSNPLLLSNPVTAAPCFAAKAANLAPAAQAAAECVGNGLGDCLMRSVASVILTFTNFLLGLSGAALNYVVYFAVFKFGGLIGNSPGVLVAWGILRDIANMILLFGFIFLGAATILNLDHFPTKRAIPRLLIFAILMNFSLFACEAVIDIANGASSLLYNQADPMATQCVGPSGTSGVTGTKCDFLNYGIAGHIMQSTGLSSIWQNQGTTTASPTALLGLAVFATIGFIVLISAAIMLVVRLVVLTFLMIVSPIGFAGMAIPFFQKFAGDWWSRVIHQSFFAPILFLFIFISLKIADSFTTININGGLAGGLGTLVSDPTVSTMGIVLVFMLVCGFLLASIIVAHRFGAVGAQSIIGMSKNIILGSYGWAGRTAGGYLGRNTVGRASNWAQKKYVSSVAAGNLKFLAGGSIDEAIENSLKRGKEAKFGSTKSFKSEQEHHKARADELAKVARFERVKKIRVNEDDPDGMVKAITEMRAATRGLTIKQIIELVNQLKNNESQLGLLAQSISSEQLEKVHDSDEVNDGLKEKMLAKRFDELAAVVKKASGGDAAAKKELDARANALNSKDIGLLAQSIHSDLLQQQDFVAALSDDQFKEGRKNNRISEEQGKKFQETRTSVLNNPVFVTAKIEGLNGEELNKVKSDILSRPDVLEKLSGRKIALIDPNKIGNDDHFDAIVNYVKSNVLTDTKKKASFQAAYTGDARVAKRWQGYGIYI